MVGCVFLVIAFKNSNSLGAAYGIAVTGTMAITSLLFYVVARGRWNWSLWHVLPLTLAFLAITGLLAAFIVSPLNPWLPATLHPLAKYGALVPAFVALWVVSVLLDFLPTIEERIPLQAYATISVAVRQRCRG